MLEGLAVAKDLFCLDTAVLAGPPLLRTLLLGYRGHSRTAVTKDYLLGYRGFRKTAVTMRTLLLRYTLQIKPFLFYFFASSMAFTTSPVISRTFLCHSGVKYSFTRNAIRWKMTIMLL